MRMADFKYSELLEDLGNNAAEFGKYLVNGTANHVCALYAQYPGFFVGGVTSDITRGLYNNLCAGRPSGLPPSPPPPPFTGGQCPAAYRVVTRFTNAGSPAFLSGDVIGPISNISVVDRGVGDSIGRWCPVIKAAGFVNPDATNAAPSAGQWWYRLDGSNAATSPYVDFAVVSVVLLDGSPDNCGNLSGGYPPVSNLPNDATGEVSGTHSNGGNYVIPILLKPSLIGEINIDVGGVNVKFDMSGAKIGGTDALSQDILDAINEGIAQVLDGQCACADVPNEDSYDIDEILSEDGVGEDGIEGLEWIRIKITSKPANAKVQFGGGADDVFYAGWVSFLANGASLPREPIHFLDSIFKAPEGCTGYQYCLYQGYAGSATEYKRPPTIPPV